MSEELDTKLLHVVKQKEFNIYDFMSGLEKFLEELLSKLMFYSSLTGKKLVVKIIITTITTKLQPRKR